MMPGWLDPLTASLVAAAVFASFALTAVARRIAVPLQMLDEPDAARKQHAAPTPLLGGLAVYLAFVLTAGAAAWLGCRWWAESPDSPRVTVMMLISAGLVCLVGLADDRRPMRARSKLLLQILACLPFVVWGRSVESVRLLEMTLDLGLFGPIFTIVWLVGCINVINLLDGLDGLAGTVALIISLTVALHAGMRDLVAVAALALLFSGCLIGFLLHNWPPARIFLGDSGSLTIGFLVGTLSLESSLKTTTGMALAIPIILVSVPVFDTLMAIVRRKLNGRSIGEADRGHIHHCLQARGLTRTQSLLAISGLCIAMAGATAFSAILANDLLSLGLCAALLGLLVAGRVFGYDETLMSLRALSTLGALMVGRWRISSIGRLRRPSSRETPEPDASAPAERLPLPEPRLRPESDADDAAQDRRAA